MMSESEIQDLASALQSLPPLPTELYRCIVDFITDPPTIHALLFVSTIFNDEAERALYRSISPRGRKTQGKLFERLYSCDRVAKLVFDLQFHVSDHISLDDYSYWSPLSLALRALVNLRSFGIRYHRPETRGMSHILSGCLFQLESFSWPFLPEGKLFHFLESQPRIRGLNLQCRHSLNNPLSSNALPQLSILTGNVVVISSFLPGRKITHLFWDPDLFDDKPEFACIGPALKNLRVLKYGGVFSAPPLHTTINYLGNLEVLQWNRSSPKPIIDNAPSFRRLQKIIFSAEPEDSQKFIERLFSSIQTLRLVELEYQGWRNTEGILVFDSFRWSRGSDIPQLLFMRDDDWMYC